jgi:methylase of polypeptide subunit release factors
VRLRGKFLPSRWAKGEANFNDVGLWIEDHQVMQYWERPLMGALARLVTRAPGVKILEVGFGLGLSAQAILDRGCSDYTVIEAHPAVAERARAWARDQRIPVRVVEGLWQDSLECLGRFDGILFDTYPTNELEYGEEQFEFVRPFMDHVPSLLAERGCFAYYTDETRDFRQAHLNMVLARFSSVELKVVEGLRPPPECEYWSHDHMVIACLSEPRSIKQ